VDLTAALALTEQEISALVGVTVRTVRRWCAGTQRPTEPNRTRLEQLVLKAHQEHSAAAHRWSASRDSLLTRVGFALMTPAQVAEWQASRDQMRAQFYPTTTIGA
jgi:hypothetical protein